MTQEPVFRAEYVNIFRSHYSRLEWFLNNTLMGLGVIIEASNTPPPSGLVAFITAKDTRSVIKGRVHATVELYPLVAGCVPDGKEFDRIKNAIYGVFERRVFRTKQSEPSIEKYVYGLQ